MYIDEDINNNNNKNFYNVSLTHQDDILQDYKIELTKSLEQLILDKKICLINNEYCLHSTTLPINYEIVLKVIKDSCIPIMTSNQLKYLEGNDKKNNPYLERAIILREVFSKNANCLAISKELQKMRIDNIEKLFYGEKMVLEESIKSQGKQINRDYIKKGTFKKLEKTVPLYDNDKNYFIKAKYSGKIKSNLFTVIVLTYKRVKTLKNVIRKLNLNRNVDKIIVVWNDQNKKDIPKKSTWPRIRKGLYFVKTKKNSLNNRFLPLDIICTDAILSLDDDQIINNNLINKGFSIWKKNQDVLVGYYTRRTFDKHKIGYFPQKRNTFDLILTGLAFIHMKYLIKYTNEMNFNIRNYIDKNMNCEDIAMNFLIANSSRKPNLSIGKGIGLHQSIVNNGLSSKKNHYKEREKCVKYFIEIYGKNPMKKSSVHLYPNEK
uniref:Glyco_transf_64 domain-containing protein n=1 Tax=Parastrongyloides trichosuri TaxID=131310 RepID=A0A0N4Z109_PARTI